MNVDRQALSSVDLVADVADGLPFDDAAALFAEQLPRALALDEALAFLSRPIACSRRGAAAAVDAQLDWVLATQYPAAQLRRRSGVPAGVAGAGRCASPRLLRLVAPLSCGTGRLLAEALAAAGFEQLRWCRHGESDWQPSAASSATTPTTTRRTCRTC